MCVPRDISFIAAAIMCFMGDYMSKGKKVENHVLFLLKVSLVLDLRKLRPSSLHFLKSCVYVCMYVCLFVCLFVCWKLLSNGPTTNTLPCSVPMTMES